MAGKKNKHGTPLPSAYGIIHGKITRKEIQAFIREERRE
jgi:hypothetical protein